MKKRKLAKSVVTVAMAALMACTFTACAKDKGGENGELNLFVWTEYVPESVIKEFENETGIKVNMTTYSSNEDMLAKVKSESAGTYDIVQPSDYMVAQMIAQDMFLELDKTKLTNLSNLSDAYMNPSYDAGNKYSIPYLGGIAAIAVNTSKVDIEITGYDDLFNPALKDTMVVLDDYRAIIGITARSMGYSMNETDPKVLKEVEEKLLTLKDNVKLYDSDSPKSALISGDCTVAMVWSAEIALAMAEDENIKIVFPKEGGYLFFDNWCVTKEAKNSENALTFINYMLRAEVAEKVAEEFPYLNPNEKAVENMGTDYSGNPAKNPPAAEIGKGEYVDNLDTDTLAIYDDMWTKLKK